MNTFIGLSGTIPCPSGMKLSISNITCDYTTSTASGVVTLSGIYSNSGINFTTRSQTSINLRYRYNEDVVVSSGVGLTNVIINYRYIGSSFLKY